MSADYYVCVWGTTGTGTGKVFATIAEGWDNGTSSLRYLPVTAQATGSDCRRATTDVAITNASTSSSLTTNSTTAIHGAFISVAANTTYHINIHSDRITFGTNASSIYSWIYAGAFTTQITVSPSTNDPLPIVVFHGTSGSSGTDAGIGCSSWNLNLTGIASRWPLNPSITPPNTSGSNAGVQYIIAAQTGTVGTIANAGHLLTDPWTGNTGIPASPLLFRLRNDGSAGTGVGLTNIYGIWRGKLKGALSATGGSFGDTITIGSDVYIQLQAGYWFLKG
jgi:hypothetical protein